jgi:UDPglucose 6-dehydrogenase
VFAGLAEHVGAGIAQVAHAIGLVERIGSHFLGSGIGWDSSCFGKDTRAPAFKGGTHDLRDAPALTLIDHLHTRGAHVRAHDPIATPHARAQDPDLPATLHDTIDDLAKGCDALVITTDWNDYRHLDWPHIRSLMRGDLVLDARNLIKPEAVRSAGLTYIGIGR